MKHRNLSVNIGTLVNHFAEGDHAEHAHVAPIYQTSTFSFPDVQTGADSIAGENPGFVYTRTDNPNARQLAAKIALLEGIDLVREHPEQPVETLVRGRMFSSGMAAITTAVLSRAGARNTVIAQQIVYGNSYNLLRKIAPRYGIEVVWVDGSDNQAWTAAFEEHPDAVLALIETPGNPTMQIVDIAHVVELAHANNAWVMVDNTFATPYCQRPLTLGADIVVHSTSKYLSGHGQIIGGAVVSRHPEFFDPKEDIFLTAARVFGGSPSPFDAWLTNIGLKTLELRMQQHIRNASEIAEWLSNHSKISQVHYPGLKGFPGHAAAARQMFNGFGGMLAFELKGGYQAGVQLMENLDLITLAVSLGNVDTLIEHPASMTHASFSPEDRELAGVTDGLIRFSAGIEDVQDLIDDLSHALEKVHI